ncbi:MAG: NAD-dependent epimerase/dehydratase family protein [Acetobacter sp.]|uniref:NAD-dependent epimerase/dehydratase family protein n=1 Tax=Acetobacter sp. TaxID=440 RepID=UPI003D0823BD
MARVFVSGANGFVGRAICQALVQAGHAVAGGVRDDTTLPEGVAPFVTGDLATASLRLDGFDAVVHAAGLAHRRGVPLEVWRRANVIASENLARAVSSQARFIYVSSIGIYGRAPSGIVTEQTASAPQDDYALSKLEAEERLADMLGPRLRVLRPAAIVGPHCPGNIPLLLKLIRSGIPLPFGSIGNARSFVDIEDVAALTTLMLQENAPSLVLAAHPEPISTPDLIRALARGLSRPARLLPVPTACLGVVARVLGREAMFQSLSGSFIARPVQAMAMGWRPARNLSASLERAAAAERVIKG